MIALAVLAAVTGMSAAVLAIIGANGGFEQPRGTIGVHEFGMFGLTCFLFGAFVVLGFATVVAS